MTTQTRTRQPRSALGDCGLLYSQSGRRVCGTQREYRSRGDFAEAIRHEVGVDVPPGAISEAFLGINREGIVEAHDAPGRGRQPAWSWTSEG